MDSGVLVVDSGVELVGSSNEFNEFTIDMLYSVIGYFHW